MSLSDIKLKYENKAKKAGSLFLLSTKDAISFIGDCFSEGLELCGVEGFKVTEKGAFQPHQEHSNDIDESDNDGVDFVNETKKFISDREGLGIWFELVYAED